MSGSDFTTRPATRASASVANEANDHVPVPLSGGWTDVGNELEAQIDGAVDGRGHRRRQPMPSSRVAGWQPTTPDAVHLAPEAGQGGQHHVGAHAVGVDHRRRVGRSMRLGLDDRHRARGLPMGTASTRTRPS